MVGIARRSELIEKRAKELSLSNKKGKLYAFKVDLTREDEILSAFKWIEENLGHLHVLVNDAAFVSEELLTEGNTEIWKRGFDVNVVAPCFTTREAVKIMRKNDIKGHIIHINSVAGHKVSPVPKMNVYAATKHAITALSETLRQELNALGSKIRVTVSRSFVFW